MKYLVAVACTLLLCLLVLITATLDNVSWWSNLFPSAFMTEEGVTDLLNRLSVAEPGYKVTIQQGEARPLSATQTSDRAHFSADFFKMSGEHEIPQSRQRSIEMYKPKR